jgi:hypothetical protein
MKAHSRPEYVHLVIVILPSYVIQPANQAFFASLMIPFATRKQSTATGNPQ